ncbi:alpha-tubulin N-acetyltransferase 1 isoform X2 [Stigmatopora nigra]
MEFPFNVHHLFPERFSVLDKTLLAGRVFTERPDLQTQVTTVIDELGKASAKAQKLTTPVTTTAKLQSQNHELYLMKDGDSQGGCGTIVGFLKVGYKKLFLLDQQGLHKEAEPLCVLDFFISENLQRNGYGLQLFNFMLQHKSLDPVLMAYDRPSPKLLSFLAKHYRLTQIVPQVNHFVVFDGFFINKSVAPLRTIPLKKQDSEIKPYSIMEREAVRQEQRNLPWPFATPQSPQRLVSSQCSLSMGSSPTRPPPQSTTTSVPGLHRNQSQNFPLFERSKERGTSQQGQVARGGLYSRHMDNKSFESLGGPLSGLRFKGDQPQFLGHTETYKLASDPSPESRLLTHSDPSTNKGQNNKNLHRGTNVEMANAKLECLPSKVPRSTTRQFSENNKHLLVKEQDRERIGLSWTVGKSCFSAQQVKQTLLSRSTCPW